MSRMNKNRYKCKTEKKKNKAEEQKVHRQKPKNGVIARHVAKKIVVSLDEKMDLHKICSWWMCRKFVKTEKWIWGKRGKCHICSVIITPCFLVCKSGIYHLCHIFTPQYLHNCDIIICQEQICASPFFHPVCFLRMCTFKVAQLDFLGGKPPKFEH